MSNQHRNPYEPHEAHETYESYDERYASQPYEQREGYGAYQPRAAAQPDRPQAAPGPYDAYEPYAQQQPQQSQQQPTAWPSHTDQQGYQPQQDPATQTWDTRSWEQRGWEASPAAEPAYRTPWPGEPLPQQTLGHAEAPAEHDTPRHTGNGDTGAGRYGDSSYGDSSYGSTVGRHTAASGTGPAPWPAALDEPGPGPGAGSVHDADGPAGEPATGDRPMTAAEKAKAEGRPQILSPGFKPALVTAVLAALLALAAPLGQFALVVPVVLLQAVTAAGWFRLNGMWPARQGIALAFLGGVAADIGLLATDALDAPTVLIGTLGVWVLLTLVLQLRSHAAPDERLYGLTAAVASAGVTVLAAGHLAAADDAVVVGGAAVAVTVLARALPLPSVASPVIALIAAAGSGVATGGLTGIGPSAALLGLAAGACALIGLRVASYDYPSRFVHMTAGVALPLAAAGPVVYVIGRALV
ncbi:hypothetical protein [Streptomyces syringium]|uniref:Membrane protein YfcA n=1 Tax=Streptomyces syringium TaxID=76729 RepID=A0ABS4Y6L8_9ACTN|nr:hypothetical protein [Streptomyces syringium]MBP2404429.1 hypothetical protein [Streptomyces syringium]